MAPIPLLLVTDLDGTLLDHHSYRWQAAEQALTQAKHDRIPVIFNSSKTLSECRLIQQQLGLQDPFTFENGAGVALPSAHWPPSAGGYPYGDYSQDAEHWIKPFAAPYAQVRKVLERLRREGSFRFTGFGDMSVTQISEATGLSQDGAANAKRRNFSEPLIWQESDRRLAEFTHALQAEGLTQARGGRFVHVMGSTDKGKAMLWLRDQYPEPHPRLAALGDSDNDIPMLSKADIAVLVRSPVRELPSFPEGEQPPRVMITEEYGPAGWNQAVLTILEEYTHG